MPWQGAERSELEHKILEQLNPKKLKALPNGLPRGFEFDSINVKDGFSVWEAAQLIDHICKFYQEDRKEPTIVTRTDATTLVHLHFEDYKPLRDQFESLTNNFDTKTKHIRMPAFCRGHFRQTKDFLERYIQILKSVDFISKELHRKERGFITRANKLIEKMNYSWEIKPYFGLTFEEIFSQPNIYSCIFKGGNNSLASLLYFLDPGTNILFFGSNSPSENYISKALAILFDAKGREIDSKDKYISSTEEKYILVEGVVANKEFNTLLVDNDTLDPIYSFVLEQIRKYATSIERIPCLSTYQVQSKQECSPLEFVEYLSRIYRFPFERMFRAGKKEEKNDKKPSKWEATSKDCLKKHEKFDLTKDLEPLAQLLPQNDGIKWDGKYFTQAFTFRDSSDDKPEDGPWGKDGCWDTCKGKVWGWNLNNPTFPEEEYQRSEPNFQKKRFLGDYSSRKQVEAVDFRKMGRGLSLSKWNWPVSVAIISTIGVGSYFAWTDRDGEPTSSAVQSSVKPIAKDVHLSNLLAYDYTGESRTEPLYLEVAPPTELESSEFVKMGESISCVVSQIADVDDGAVFETMCRDGYCAPLKGVDLAGDRLNLEYALSHQLDYDTEPNTAWKDGLYEGLYNITVPSDPTYLASRLGYGLGYSVDDNHQSYQEFKYKKKSRKKKPSEKTKMFCSSMPGLPCGRSELRTDHTYWGTREGGTVQSYIKKSKDQEQTSTVEATYPPYPVMPMKTTNEEHVPASSSSSGGSGAPYKCKTTLCNKL